MSNAKAEIATLRAGVAALRETEETLLKEIADIRNDDGPPTGLAGYRVESLKAQVDVTQHRRESAERRLEARLSEAHTDRAIAVQALIALAAVVAALASAASALVAWAAMHP